MDTVIILGGAGDLARRLLLPGIAEFASLHDTSVRVIGVGRDEVDYPSLVAESLSGVDVPDVLSAEATFVVADATDSEDMGRVLGEAQGTTVLYYALPPSVSVDSIAALEKVELPADLVFAMEKPYGETAEEADDLDRQLLAVTDEDHIFRVDHFLCEAAVTNLAGLIRANLPLRATWSSDYIEAIDIVFDETLGLEGRAEFYDSTGALRDMIQSHLLQVLAHVLCVDGRAEVSDVLDATSVVEGSARRARYAGYAEEEGVDPARGTETLAQLDFAVDLPRWAETRIRLRSGKALGNPEQAIIVHYRAEAGKAPARLVVPFADNLLLELNIPDPGDPGDLERATLHSDTVPSRLSPYGRVARALLTGNHSVEVPVGTPQRAWEILRPVLDAFAADEIPLEEYPAGSAGPEGWR
ncbi:MAG: glucose-6-phosphate dehydrogenase [Corynebacterium sp.]|uniref:glucose-6-phosphate dehydrogenase n=1 Tax=Corynebacterium sp. TaxID=1720 RepID=UPI0026E00D36|nr:glucose-6-phosphate dehydrogenase [Corynebacterium sp.]MDO5668797.1 glucose-6-phosphate dehydrogenase [Corynebacterium sp.]